VFLLGHAFRIEANLLVNKCETN